jgi:hypothetical protein
MVNKKCYQIEIDLVDHKDSTHISFFFTAIQLIFHTNNISLNLATDVNTSLVNNM